MSAADGRDELPSTGRPRALTARGWAVVAAMAILTVLVSAAFADGSDDAPAEPVPASSPVDATTTTRSTTTTAIATTTSPPTTTEATDPAASTTTTADPRAPKLAQVTDRLDVGDRPPSALGAHARMDVLVTDGDTIVVRYMAALTSGSDAVTTLARTFAADARAILELPGVGGVGVVILTREAESETFAIAAGVRRPAESLRALLDAHTDDDIASNPSLVFCGAEQAVLRHSFVPSAHLDCEVQDATPMADGQG